MKRFQKFNGVDGKDVVNSTLKSIELNITTTCNRSCSFCPHAWGFKKEDKRDKFVSLEIVDKFIDWLSDYNNQITLCGLGEPTMHPDIEQILDKFQKLNNKIILVTNGYKLKDVAHHLGKIRARVSLYEPMDLSFIDCDILDYTNEGENVYFNNRSYGDGIQKSCFLPSYKMVVDTNGGILPCDNNWQNILYLANIQEDSLESAWLEKFDSFRTNCSINRNLNNYCKNCNAHGTLYGQDEMTLLTNRDQSTILSK